MHGSGAGFRQNSFLELTKARFADGESLREVVMLRCKAVCLAEDDLLHAMVRIRAQDDDFCARLRAAIEAGQESCPIGVCTDPGTKRPVLNYQRDECIELSDV
jgi:hypothetical protein